MSTNNTTTATVSKNPLDFLWSDAPATTNAIKLPEGGNTAGFAGMWKCSVVYRFWSAQKIEDHGHAADSKRSTASGNFYYFLSRDKAEAAGKAVGQEFPPNTIWRWEIMTSDVLTEIGEEARSRFGDVISQECNITTLMSKKQRHEYHMITLPSAIQSVALLGGMINQTIFDYESLRVNSDMIDEAYQAKVIGVGNDYEKSELWIARTAIWNALGEKNPKAYTIGQGKFDVTSEQLEHCLKLVYRPTSIFARLVSVPDPRADAVYGDESKRLTVPVVTNLWRDKASLMADLQLDEKAPATAANNGNNGNAAVGGPKLPAAWTEYPDDWKGTVREIIKPFAGSPKPVLAAKLREQNDSLKQNYGATADEFLAWAEAV